MTIPIDVSNLVLETKRLLIKAWKQEYLDDFYEYASVDGVGQMAGWAPHTSKEESLKILNMFIEGKNQFALILKENSKVIGSLGLEEMTDLEELYADKKGREIGYVLSKSYWGQGLMPEAVARVIDYCFNDLGCELLLCRHFTTNAQSERVIKKAGFTYLKDTERKGIDGNIRTSKLYIKFRTPM